MDEHQLWQEQNLFEESARMPLLVAGPGVKARGMACPRLGALVDVYPTFADLCGLRAPANLEGVSFRPLLVTPGLPWKAAAFTEVSRGRVSGQSIRTEHWRDTEWREKKGRVGAELYDRRNDPRGFTNLADDAKHAERVAELRRLLEQGWKGALPPRAAKWFVPQLTVGFANSL